MGVRYRHLKGFPISSLERWLVAVKCTDELCYCNISTHFLCLIRIYGLSALSIRVDREAIGQCLSVFIFYSKRVWPLVYTLQTLFT